MSVEESGDFVEEEELNVDLVVLVDVCWRGQQHTCFNRDSISRDTCATTWMISATSWWSFVILPYQE